MISRIFNCILLGSIFTACGVSMGDRIDTENLQVYYLDNVTKDEAIAFTQFWKKNQLIGSEKQTIQLDRVEDIFTVKLIEKKAFHEKALSVPEQASLYELRRMIEEQVVKGAVEIQITDNTFRPIERVQ